MTPDEHLVDAALRAWKTNVDRAETFFASLSDDQLQLEIAPGRNRLVYLLGHLVAVHDRMLPLLGAGERQHEQLDTPFLTSADREHAALPPAAELRKAFVDVNRTLWDAISKWTPAQWLSRHTAVSDEDFAKEPHRNRFSVLLSRTTHLASHQGQLILAKSRD
ncbi:MAG: DinB family protein [Gemmatimonadaceae bacterium]